jgi:hypothetical protein
MAQVVDSLPLSSNPNTTKEIKRSPNTENKRGRNLKFQK